MFGPLLFTEFSKNVSGLSKFDEVSLFRALRDSFAMLAKSATSKGYTVSVIHSHPSITRFDIDKSAFLPTRAADFPKKSELGDLLFVIYDRRAKKARISVMQNKKHKKFGIPSTGFYLDPAQLYLMQGNGKSVVIPSTLPSCLSAMLRDTKNPPLCNYGVFYERTTSNFDMAYFAVDLLSTLKPMTMSRKGKINSIRKANFRGKFHAIRKLSGWVESDVEGACCIKSFGDLLVDNMVIGKPADGSDLVAIADIVGNLVPSDFARFCRTMDFPVGLESVKNGMDFSIEHNDLYSFSEAGISIVFIGVNNETSDHIW